MNNPPREKCSHSDEVICVKCGNPIIESKLTPQHTSPEKEAFDRFAGATKGNDLIALLKPEPSFTEKTLEEFREKFDFFECSAMSQCNVEQWLSSKLSEAQNEGVIEGYRKCKDRGARQERTRILTLIERAKIGENEALFADDPDKKLQAGYYIGYNAALTSLAAELQND